MGGKAILVWTFVILNLAFFVNYLADNGVFRRIETTRLDRCRLIVPSGGDDLGLEQAVIDYEMGIAYLGGDDRTWINTFTLPLDVEKQQGQMYIFNFQSESFLNLNLVNYPHEHFHPLGLSLLPKKTKHNRLFVVNYREKNGKLIGAVDIFKIDPDNNKQLELIDSVVDPLFTAPDDVLAIDENSFYVTNYIHNRIDESFFLHNIELLTMRPWTNVILCLKVAKSEWKCSVIVDSIAMANGIAASADFKTVYLGASLEKRIHIYQRHSENNSLSLIKHLKVPFIVDNVFVNDKEELIAAGHPKGLAFMAHAQNSKKNRAPSEVVIFSKPLSDSTFDTLLLTNGEQLSASTVGATYKNKLIVGACLDGGILLCDNSS